MTTRKTTFHTLALLVAIALVGAFPAVAQAEPSVDPGSVEAWIYPGGSIDVNKLVGTAEIPPMVDVCLLEDETGSFGDDIGYLQAAGVAAAIFNSVIAVAPDSQFAVSGFRDYTDSFVYRLLSTMSPNLADWQAGIALLSAPPGAGQDEPEAQYDAIVSAVSGSPFGPPCGYRADPNVARVLVVTTDNVFHVPPAPYVNDLATTTAALNAANVTLIGLKAPGAGGELDALAAATGGSVQALSSSGDNIGAAIVAGLGNLPVEVAMSSDCPAPIGTSFAPASMSVTSGEDAAFVETISVAAGAAGGTYECTDYVSYNGAVSETVFETKTIHVPGIELSPETDTNELGFDLDHTVTATVTAGDDGTVEGADVSIAIVSGPNTGLSVTGTTDATGQISFSWTPSVDPSSLGADDIVATLYDPDGNPVATDDADKDWVDTTPPDAECVETVNPHGNKIPKAPGNGGQGQNQDGFYQLLGSDVVWPLDSLEVFVIDDDSGTVFGPFAVGINIKYTEDDTAVPEQKKIGGPNSAVPWHIIGNGDAIVDVVDGSGNIGTATCLVPPPPK